MKPNTMLLNPLFFSVTVEDYNISKKFLTKTSVQSKYWNKCWSEKRYTIYQTWEILNSISTTPIKSAHANTRKRNVIDVA